MIKLTTKELEEKSNFIDKYMGVGNAASLSEVDSNANVDSKNVATLNNELKKDIYVQINRYKLGKRIEELFGSETKNEYYRQLDNHEIYSHDESAVIMPYCVAIDLYPFINSGDKLLGGSSEAPKHLDSFCGTYVNLIFFIAGQFAGAVADVSFLTYFDYFARKQYGDNYLETNAYDIKNYFQQVIYTLNDPAVGRGCQAVFYNTSIFDENYFSSLFGKLIFPDGTSPRWDTVNKLQKFFMHWFNKERERAILTFPVITAAMQTKDGKAKDLDFKNFITKEMSEGNSFFIYSSDSVDSLSSCCRLRNELSIDTFAYTLGGTGLATGSKKVITLNLNRFIQNKAKNSELSLTTQIKNIHKYLYAYDTILRDEQKAKMLPVYDAGFISLDKQYLTIGLNGIVEAAEFLGLEISDNDSYKQFLVNTLKEIKNCNKEESDYYSKLSGNKIKYNAEFVPAENVGPKNAKWDKKDGYIVPRDCYNSYLYKVEDDSIDIFDKFNLHGKDIIQYLDGGSAYHMNLAECPTQETWLKIIDYSTKVGCNYWTYNVKSTLCEDCGFINKETKDHCTKCGSKNVSYLTRVIGYLKKIKSFSNERQKEELKRVYS